MASWRRQDRRETAPGGYGASPGFARGESHSKTPFVNECCLPSSHFTMGFRGLQMSQSRPDAQEGPRRAPRQPRRPSEAPQERPKRARSGDVSRPKRGRGNPRRPVFRSIASKMAHKGPQGSPEGAKKASKGPHRLPKGLLRKVCPKALWPNAQTILRCVGHLELLALHGLVRIGET